MIAGMKKPAVSLVLRGGTPSTAPLFSGNQSFQDWDFAQKHCNKIARQEDSPTEKEATQKLHRGQVPVKEATETAGKCRAFQKIEMDEINSECAAANGKDGLPPFFQNVCAAAKLLNGDKYRGCIQQNKTLMIKAVIISNQFLPEIIQITGKENCAQIQEP